MTVQPPQNFSPHQILDAARRAEAEGRRDFANQFYRHLLDYYPGSQEALAAREGLMRLAQGEPHPQDPMAAALQPPPPPTHFAPSPPGPAAHRRPAHMAQGNDSERRRHHGETEAPAVRDYRTGRAIARLMSWSGGALALTGTAAIPIAMVMPRLLSNIPIAGGYVTSPGAGIALLLIGLAMMLFGQLFRAVLDIAIATRNLAQSKRRSQGHHGNGHSARHIRD